MRFDVVTVFPEAFQSFLGAGLLGKAIEGGTVAVRLLSPRDFARDRHRTIDDAPYGGGSGMVMRVGPVAEALDSLDASRPDGSARALRVLLTPQGTPFAHAHAARYSQLGALALVAGRYEGVDERICAFVDEEVSIGDFVLMGGEVAAMAVMEAAARLVPGVLGNPASTDGESHSAGLLEYPQYTRPSEYRDLRVPDILRSGDHAAIARWRRAQQLSRTRTRRPDLFARHTVSDEDRELLDEQGRAVR